MTDKDDVQLSVYLNPAFTPLVTSFAEESAKAFGLDRNDALKLTLACEEIFTYMCAIDRENKPLTITAGNGVYFVQVRILCGVARFDPGAFNLTTHISAKDEAELEDMGLLIASRSVDRFGIVRSSGDAVEVVLIKEKMYPEAVRGPVEVKPLEAVNILTPDPETLKLFTRQIVSTYADNLYPPDFRFPGKVVDMVASGEYNALLAVDDKGSIGGGLMWRRRIAGKKMVECYGPYLFNQLPGSGIAEKLIDALIGSISKTDALCLINEYPTPELPKQYFEQLGVVDYYTPDGTAIPWPFYYRFLKEDLGAQVWAHPALEEFLRDQYKTLFFARKIVLTGYGGETRPPHSVLAAQFVRTQQMVFLRPIWDGADASQNISKHIEILRNEGMRIIFFEIDLGYPWQVNFAPALLENGFTPRLILPYAGKADIVIFQYGEGVQNHA
ncbi:MAG: hypothetical protein A4E63_01844 [Syntrophorhabdus sp. PtaU1.Bin050]|nr:MAG: hypothetical protein A4E63_01844 [Syntrophorhabdus sp. PtaU1.Bin050]